MEYKKFESEVAKIIKQYPLIKIGKSHIKLCKKLFKQGYSVRDTATFLLLK